MIEIGATLPSLDVTDVFGRRANTDELATTGVPIVLFSSSASRMCRALEPVFSEIAELDNGDYNVWHFVHGSPEAAVEAFPKLSGQLRTFAFGADWEGLDAFDIVGYPSIVAADRANAVIAAQQGWDRTRWTGFVNELRSMLGWRPVVFSRKLPDPGTVAARVPQPG
jgi:hypothetical protein